MYSTVDVESTVYYEEQQLSLSKLVQACCLDDSEREKYTNFVEQGDFLNASKCLQRATSTPVILPTLCKYIKNGTITSKVKLSSVLQYLHNIPKEVEKTILEELNPENSFSLVLHSTLHTNATKIPRGEKLLKSPYFTTKCRDVPNSLPHCPDEKDYTLVTVWDVGTVDSCKNVSSMARKIAKCIQIYSKACGIQNRYMIRFSSESGKPINLQKIFAGKEYPVSKLSSKWSRLAFSCIEAHHLGDYYYQPHPGSISIEGSSECFFWLFGFSWDDDHFNKVENMISNWLSVYHDVQSFFFEIPALEYGDHFLLNYFEDEVAEEIFDKVKYSNNHYTILGEIDRHIIYSTTKKQLPENTSFKEHYQIKESSATPEIIRANKNLTGSI